MATILFTREGNVTTLTLNRPDKLNSFTESMHLELADALSKIEQDSTIRAIILTGAGRAFSAGQDLSDRVMGDDDAAPDLGDTLERLYNPLIRRIRALDRPVVCAVNGIAAGAAANIALACDIVVAARSASFLQPFCRLGLLPDAGGTFNLVRLIGPARARGLAMLGSKLSAENAKDWGLIWDVVDDEDLSNKAQALAANLAAGPTKGYALIKKAIDAASTNSLNDQLDLERDLQRVAGESQDYAEGVRAFMEKRQPRFEGR